MLRHRRFAIAVAGAAALAALVVAIAAPRSGGTHGKPVRLPPRLGIASATAAENARPAQSSPSESVQVVRPSLSRPLRSIRPVRRSGKSSFKSFETPLRGEVAAPPSTKAGSAALQRSAPRGLMPPPIVNFEGVDNRNFVLPPDTEGDIGPNHYMQWVNLSFAVYNRTGGLVYGPADGNTFFTGLPACGSALGNGGDPVVLYDQFAGRWLASQLAYPNLPNGPVYQCVAVSSTDDPTGTWCRYEIQAFATKLNDYPKFGIWPTQNAYFLAVNQFDLPSFDFVGQGIFALNRDRMLACQTAQVLYKDMFPVDPNLGACCLPTSTAPRCLRRVRPASSSRWTTTAPVSHRISWTSGTRPRTGTRSR